MISYDECLLPPCLSRVFLYALLACAEDRATLGSDLSADIGGHTEGRASNSAFLFSPSGGLQSDKTWGCGGKAPTICSGWCEHKSWKIFKNPPILQGSIDDSQKLPRQGDDRPPRTSGCFEADIVMSEIRAVTHGDQGALHQSGAPQFIAALGDPAAAFRFVRVGHPGYNAEIGHQFPLPGKIVNLADGGQQGAAADIAESLDALEILIARQLWPLFLDGRLQLPYAAI